VQRKHLFCGFVCWYVIFFKLLYFVKQLIVLFHYYVAIIYTSIITNHVSTNLLSIVSILQLKPYTPIELYVNSIRLSNLFESIIPTSTIRQSLQQELLKSMRKPCVLKVR